MIESALLFIEKIIVSVGPLGLFVAGFLEEVIAPIPSTLVITSGGFFIMGGKALGASSLATFLFKVVLPVSLGLILGSLIIYKIFYIFGEKAVSVFGKYLGVSFADIEKLKEKMSLGMSDEISIFIARALPFFPILIVNIFCGLIRYPLLKFFLISFAGILVRAITLGFVGWQLGMFDRAVYSKLENIESFLTVLIVALLVYLIFKNKRKNSKTVNTELQI